MSKKYRTITGVYGYKACIYENCNAMLQTNGRRFRTLVDGVKWDGNTGGFHTFTTYYDLAEGRKLLRRFRQAVIEHDLKRTDRGPTPIEVLRDEY